MANVLDVAEYLLKDLGKITAWKLQKLVYYSQAWHSVWDEEILFPSRVEAWANGPVCKDLYNAHKGQFSVDSVGGDADNLSGGEKETLDAVIKFYSRHSGQELSDLTHAERPWKDARKGLSSNDRSNKEITPERMSEYYGSL